ncbi:lipopolysaccharide export system ATP-binding protein [Methylomarinovum caldicuralii]|uniref:Lipopolysaccharide export system ATP-binding protein LptB n=1 Tax=Methylomarinovum caldicuralii TaxID=438856 RepID=A0AAU9CHJ2_9GAMM|nr:LPS export ABC transporter ATP-binding protein [Methylomarinovum caldicuralii]BCX81061.1 lipopolysaccharide export system ATP-binding protein [Methylomarinovum caldicuralii]
MAALLEAERLVKRYRRRTVVDGVSLTLKSGEIVGLLGPNGAGKTTTFYMIVGLIAPSDGRIRLDGQDITALPIHVRAHFGIGYLPQEASVFRRLSVMDNLLGVLELRPELTPGQRELIAAELLQEFGLTPLAPQQAASLSGGERRRLEIARALALEPRFVLLDEPFAGVDPISILDIQKIVRHLSERGIGVLITDHNVRETLGICQRAYIINQGRVLTTGAPEQILAHPQVREVYLGENFNL